MLERLLRSPEVTRFLSHFPQTQWEDCVELTLLLGIRTAQRMFPSGCSLEALAQHLHISPRPSQNQEEGRVERTQRPATARGDFERPVQPTKRRGTSDLTEVRSALASGRPSLPKSLKHVTSRIKAEVQKDIERYFTPTKSRELEQDRFEGDSKRPSEKPLAHYPPRPVGKSDRRAQEISLLREPKINTALVERLEETESTESSVIRITDRFLSDPLMTSLSNRASPRAREWRFPSQLDFE